MLSWTKLPCSLLNHLSKSIWNCKLYIETRKPTENFQSVVGSAVSYFVVCRSLKIHICTIPSLDLKVNLWGGLGSIRWLVCYQQTIGSRVMLDFFLFFFLQNIHFSQLHTYVYFKNACRMVQFSSLLILESLNGRQLKWRQSRSSYNSRFFEVNPTETNFNATTK